MAEVGILSQLPEQETIEADDEDIILNVDEYHEQVLALVARQLEKRMDNYQR